MFASSKTNMNANTSISDDCDDIIHTDDEMNNQQVKFLSQQLRFFLITLLTFRNTTTKDIAYICVAPDNDYICSMTKVYFREFSTHYELCRLGVHRPLLKWFRDNGLLRINSASTFSSQNSDSSSSTTTTMSNVPTSSIPVDQWFTDNETHPVGARLKLYAQTLKANLQHLLQTQTLDHTLHEEAPKREVFRAPNDISSNTSTTPSSVEMNSGNDIGLSAPSSSPSSADKSNVNLYANFNSSSNAITGGLGDSMNNNLMNSAIDPHDLLAFDSL
ncbi:unnamed protein product, partial [Didymodactylos carnosus]